MTGVRDTRTGRSSLSVVFAGGGTGGHLFPGIAIAEALRAARPDARISFAGSKHKIEARVVPAQGYPFDPIWISGLRRRFSLHTALLPLKVLVSLWQSARILRVRRPDVVVGTGGYVSGPVLYAAARLGRRTLIHEQNEVPGATTRRLAPIVDEVHVTYPSSAARLPRARRVVVSGNPVRPSLTPMDAGDARRRFGLHPDRSTVLVFGGSLGAASINRATEAALDRICAAGAQVLWQTGEPGLEDARRAAAHRTGQVAVLPFIDDMGAAYSAAVLAVCRAGATSLAELAAMGVPAILVPYPYAAADHQRHNARAVAAAGAAVVLEDGDLAELPDVLQHLLGDDERLRSMAAKAAELAAPRAAHDIAAAIIALATGGAATTPAQESRS